MFAALLARIFKELLPVLQDFFVELDLGSFESAVKFLNVMKGLSVFLDPLFFRREHFGNVA